eukprot:CAMPEP_0170535626 /NCGR_PEP_ID=MMETSP0209-20121228/101706_1 /TAXON_ID=665100 ORGANISM="Litonotus pictus, Strain P1" /NCGR_SAMPLE_ID=MMETSP0209 /ASSEMBLY_ACC=CAM_ASM_000301 /LENGTH=153 /DNA_ID=CAMNT_0010836919 /DNA_START=579 /DNA_END=1037 /DNA_ORIENTATION=-
MCRTATGQCDTIDADATGGYKVRTITTNWLCTTDCSTGNSNVWCVMNDANTGQCALTTEGNTYCRNANGQCETLEADVTGGYKVRTIDTNWLCTTDCSTGNSNVWCVVNAANDGRCAISTDGNTMCRTATGQCDTIDADVTGGYKVRTSIVEW